MTTYTADAVAVLAYLVDALPKRADRAFAEAEAGETIIEVPGTAFAEVLYSVSRDKDVRGATLARSPEDVRRAVVANGPVRLAPIDDDAFVEYARLVDEFSIHDGLVIASHRARETDAVITSDGAISGAGVPTIWNG